MVHHNEAECAMEDDVVERILTHSTEEEKGSLLYLLTLNVVDYLNLLQTTLYM